MKRFRFIFAFALTLALILNVKLPAEAAAHTDVIHNYDIYATVLDDATVSLDYHIDWEVLESDKAGPVSWVRVGIPNSHIISYSAMSDNISKITYTNSGGYFIDIYFTRSYYEGETISFDVNIIQDYMYETDSVTEGETVYTFTPGWFDEVDVESMTIHWNCDNAASFSPSCMVEDGYLTWSDSLSAGDRFTVEITYPNDAYDFMNHVDTTDTYTSYSYSTNNSYTPTYYSNESDDKISSVIFIFFVTLFVLGVKAIVRSSVSYTSYNRGSGLSSPTTTKIERRLVTYYPTCRGCGAVRPEKAEKCEYCGRSFIEKEEYVTETQVQDPDKYKDEGVYRYGSSANTYIHVHHVPVLKHSSDYHHHYTSIFGGDSSSSGSHHSSCVHSSCACACACACAGGGRAGCSTKDFYNTNLKLSQLRKKAVKSK